VARGPDELGVFGVYGFAGGDRGLEPMAMCTYSREMRTQSEMMLQPLISNRTDGLNGAWDSGHPAAFLQVVATRIRLKIEAHFNKCKYELSLTKNFSFYDTPKIPDPGYLKITVPLSKDRNSTST